MLLLTFCSIEKIKIKFQDTFYDIETLNEKGPLRDGCITQDGCPNVFSFLLAHTIPQKLAHRNTSDSTTSILRLKTKSR